MLALNSNKTTYCYCLFYLIFNSRPKHSKELISKTRKLDDKDFIVRMLYKGVY